MATYGNSIMGFFGGGASGGGGGGGVSAVGGVSPISSSGGATPNISISQSNGSTNGFLSSADWSTFNNKVGGSGTANKLPKWASASTLGDSQIFDNGTSVGVGTTTPTSGFLFDVNTSAIVRNYFQVGTFTKGANQTAKIMTDGIITSEGGFNLATVSATDVNKTGIYNGGNILQFWAGNNQLANFGLASAGGTLFDFIAGWTFNTGATGISKAIRVQSSLSSNSANSGGLTQIYIDPTYNQGIFGTGTLRGIYYNPTTSVLNGSTHIAWENTSGDVIFGNLAGVSSRAVMVDTNGKISYQLDDFSCYNGLGAQDLISCFSGGQYRFGNIPDGYLITIDSALQLTTFDNISHKINGIDLKLNMAELVLNNSSLIDGTPPSGLGVTYLQVTLPDGNVYKILLTESLP
jgi:hypothetical protein